MGLAAEVVGAVGDTLGGVFELVRRVMEHLGDTAEAVDGFLNAYVAAGTIVLGEAFKEVSHLFGFLSLIVEGGSVLTQGSSVSLQSTSVCVHGLNLSFHTICHN